MSSSKKTAPPFSEQRKETESHQLSTGYPQVNLLKSLQVLNSNLTGLWHAMCNKCLFPNATTEVEMSKQRLPVSTESERPVTAKQRSLVDLIMSTGMSVQECADELGKDVANCYRDLRKPHVRKYLQERTLEHIGILAPFAARTQQSLLSSDSDHVKASVAENILDRHLGKPVMRQQVALQGQINVTIDLG